MNNPFKKYRAILISCIVAVFSVYIVFFDAKEFTTNPSEIVFTFIACWGFVYFFTNRFFEVKKRKYFFLKVLLLIILQVVAYSIGRYVDTPDNPLIFTIEVLFWVLTIYTFSPRMFTKYRVPLIVFYTTITIAFNGVRLFTALTNEQYGFMISLFMYSIVAVIVLWIVSHWKSLQSLREEKVKAELMLLKTQVNPHFLFNTLNNLYGLTVEKSDDAPKLVLKLSDLLRYTIYHGEKEFVLVSQEIDYLENYIELQKIRYHKNVAITFDCDLDTPLKIAPLLFIILVENAFKHGVEVVAQDAYVHIRLETTKNKITFEVENNFKTPKTPLKKGIGLENLTNRLDILYPNTYTLEIDKKEPVYQVTLEIHT